MGQRINHDDRNAASEHLLDVLGNAEIRFGLVAQGKYETVARLRHDGASWEEVGAEIGWTPKAVEEHFEMVTSALAERLLDGITVALQEFDTATLRAIADYRDTIHKDGWMQRLIREYVEVWR